MNERLKAIRKALSLSQEAFGKKLGVTGAGISRIENGVRNLTEQMILSICREFNVREEWLRNGCGEMFLDSTEDVFSKAAALSNDIFIRSFIVEYWKLDNDSKKLFRNFIHKLSDNMKAEEIASKKSVITELEIPTIDENDFWKTYTVEEAEATYTKSHSKNVKKTDLPASNTTSADITENQNKAANQ